MTQLPDSQVSWLRLQLSRHRSFGADSHRDHWSSAGGLEQSGRTWESRTRFQYDHRWNCFECRPYKEKKEGDRILTAFDDSDMWVTVVSTGDTLTVKNLAGDAGVQYVSVPISGRAVVLTTGPLDVEGDDSELVENITDFTVNLLMPLRWLGTLSSSRGLLPPARPLTGLYEAHHPGTRRRCWHLHESRDEAGDCAEEWKSVDGVTTGWYVRSTSEWRKMGRFEKTGRDLRQIADQLGIKTSVDMVSDLDLLTFEPMGWEDERYEALRREAGWTPPSDTFQPPPLEVHLTVTIRKGAASA